MRLHTSTRACKEEVDGGLEEDGVSTGRIPRVADGVLASAGGVAGEKADDLEADHPKSHFGAKLWKPCKIWIRYLEDGTRVRVSRGIGASGSIIPRPEILKIRSTPRPTVCMSRELMATLNSFLFQV
ncbi:hypothetical protein Ancab_022265 [Ancistrocladus abbreviatus]